MTGRPVELDRRLDAVALRSSLEHDVLTGLSARPKRLSPVWFYDPVGCELFEEITELEEYYPTRAERLLLETFSVEIAKLTMPASLVELGAGACSKTRVVLDALDATGSLELYVGVDVAEPTIWSAACEIADDYPELDVRAVIADFHDLAGLLDVPGPRLVAFLGGTIGNFEPDERDRFLHDLRVVMDDDADYFLLGTDLIKERARLVAAYDDARGVTAAFNRNILEVLNRELRADFDTSAFQHVALFDEEHSWIEMRLRALSAQRVTFAALDTEIHLAPGEEVRTEISTKFTKDGLASELNRAGFEVVRQFDGDAGDFLLTLSRPI